MIKDLFSLDKKIIVITGAAGMLGKSFAKAIIDAEGFPILLDINKKELDKFKKKYPLRCDSFRVDITNEKSLKLLSRKILLKYKKIDGLVNNAANNPKVESGSKNFSRLENFSLKSWNKDIAVNLTGSFLTSKYFGKIISRNKSGGIIINISSDLSIIAPDQRLYKKNNLTDLNQPVKPVTYSVTKSGLNGLTKYLSTYWLKEKIRCNSMCLGGVLNNQDKTFLDRVNKKIPMGRLADPDEYNGTLVWMLSDAASYLNGSIVVVDGGRTVW